MNDTVGLFIISGLLLTGFGALAWLLSRQKGRGGIDPQALLMLQNRLEALDRTYVIPATKAREHSKPPATI